MNAILANHNIQYIQEVRLIHALAEIYDVVFVPSDQLYKFRLLIDKYKLRITEYDNSNVPIAKICINHSIPKTQVNDIIKPLIFPRKIFDGTSEEIAKSNDIAFIGLLTSQRRKHIYEYIKSHKGRRHGKNNIFNKIYNNILSNDEHYIFPCSKTLIIKNSNNGRKWPCKAWDEEYYSQLCKSRFVLCPNGDYIWTYRFFEAILCNAIPIVQDKCAMYDGYKYYTFANDINLNEWNYEYATHNINKMRSDFCLTDNDVNVIRRICK